MDEYRHYRSGRPRVQRGAIASQEPDFGDDRQQPWSEIIGGTCRGAWPVEEAAGADIVLVAVRWVDLEKALGGLPAWNGSIVIDGTNPVAFLDPDSPGWNRWGLGN